MAEGVEIRPETLSLHSDVSTQRGTLREHKGYKDGRGFLTLLCVSASSTEALCLAISFTFPRTL